MTRLNNFELFQAAVLKNAFWNTPRTQLKLETRRCKLKSSL